MDYSLLIGIHDRDRTDGHVSDPFDSEENGIEDEDAEENAGGCEQPTPPDSPMCAGDHQIYADGFDPDLDVFAVKCSDR